MAVACVDERMMAFSDVLSRLQFVMLSRSEA